MSVRFRDIFGPGCPPSVTLGQVPRTYQIDDALEFLETERCADYSDVGTGKSLVSYMYAIVQMYNHKPVLALMPPSLIPQYLEQFRSVVRGHHFDVVQLHADRSKRHKEMAAWTAGGTWPDMLVMSYQLFVKYAQDILALGKYKVVIADEAHCASNISTQNFSQLFLFVERTPRCGLLVMTATPTPTELQGAYGQIKLRHPKAYASLDQFDRMHTVYATKEIYIKDKQGNPRPRRIKTIEGYKNIELLEHNLMLGAVRRRAKDVLSLADPTITDLKVELEKEHDALYRKLLQERMLELGDEVLVARNAQALRQMALQIITNPTKYMEGAPFKATPAPLALLKALIESLPLKETKLIVFCHFKDTVKMLSQEMSDLNPALIYGESNTEANVQKLLTDPTCRLGLLNYASGGAGFNLQSVCHHVVFFEAVGSPGMLQQALGRVNRSGQTEPVVAWIFRYALSLSSALFSKAFLRAEDIRGSLGDSGSFVDFVVDEFDNR